MNKKDLSESDKKAKFITPEILKAGWDEQTQLGRLTFTKVYPKVINISKTAFNQPN